MSSKVSLKIFHSYSAMKKTIYRIVEKFHATDSMLDKQKPHHTFMFTSYIRRKKQAQQSSQNNFTTHDDDDQ
jgi:hypothetical protein